MELFRTQRENLVDAFKEKRQPFVATTKPYKSTRSIVGSVVDNGNGVAFAVFPAQQVVFFDYQIGQSLADGFGGQFNAPDSWTNMQKAAQTNGAVRFVIEGISVNYRNPRFQYAAAAIPAQCTTPTVQAFLAGNAAAGITGTPAPQGLDAAAIVAPPQLHSPFNLEASIAQAAAACTSIYVVFDQERTDLIGSLDEFPVGGAASYLRSIGAPEHSNRYRIPEGYLWREAGQPDSSLNVNLNLREPLVFPITLLTLPGATSVAVPQKVALDITMRLHGLAVRPPSGN